MNAQVVPFISPTDAADISFWQQLGWQGALFAVIVMSFLFAVVKGNVKLVGIGANERGLREVCGFPLWVVKRALHLHIEGLFEVRKVSTAILQIVIVGFANTPIISQYEVTVKIQVKGTKKALIKRIYRAQDNNKDNMDNSEAEKQVTSSLKRHVRRILELDNFSADLVEALLEIRARKAVAKYGYRIVEVEACELVSRPASEIAAAMKSKKEKYEPYQVPALTVVEELV